MKYFLFALSLLAVSGFRPLIAQTTAETTDSLPSAEQPAESGDDTTDEGKAETKATGKKASGETEPDCE